MIFTKYTSCTYNIELDKFIFSLLPKITPNDLKFIEAMLQSTDPSVINMRLKLLYSYDISNSMCKIGLLLLRTYNNIKYSTIIKSIRFKHILNFLNITQTDLSSRSNFRILNILYSNSNISNIEKQYIKDLVVQQVTENTQHYWDFTYKTQLNNIQPIFKFTIE